MPSYVEFTVRIFGQPIKHHCNGELTLEELEQHVGEELEAAVLKVIKVEYRSDIEVELTESAE